MRSALFAAAFIYSASIVVTCPYEPGLNFWMEAMGGALALWPLSYLISMVGRIGREAPKMRSVRWQTCLILLLVLLSEYGRRVNPVADSCPVVRGEHLGPSVLLNGIDCSNENLEGVWLSGSEIQNANFSRANLSGAALRRANLNHADFTGADLSGADIGLAWLHGLPWLAFAHGLGRPRLALADHG